MTKQALHTVQPNRTLFEGYVTPVMDSMKGHYDSIVLDMGHSL